LAESLLDSGVALLELSQEDALAVVRPACSCRVGQRNASVRPDSPHTSAVSFRAQEAALLAASSFFDSARAVKQAHAAADAEGWRADAGGETLGARLRTALA
jgi:hypothetical protein